MPWLAPLLLCSPACGPPCSPTSWLLLWDPEICSGFRLKGELLEDEAHGRSTQQGLCAQPRAQCRGHAGKLLHPLPSLLPSVPASHLPHNIRRRGYGPQARPDGNTVMPFPNLPTLSTGRTIFFIFWKGSLDSRKLKKPKCLTLHRMRSQACHLHTACSAVSRGLADPFRGHPEPSPVGAGGTRGPEQGTPQAFCKVGQLGVTVLGTHSGDTLSVTPRSAAQNWVTLASHFTSLCLSFPSLGEAVN